MMHDFGHERNQKELFYNELSAVRRFQTEVTPVLLAE